jgi:hypothetical protein
MHLHGAEMPSSMQILLAEMRQISAIERSNERESGIDAARTALSTPLTKRWAAMMLAACIDVIAGRDTGEPSC